jgi:hypothetical protein
VGSDLLHDPPSQFVCILVHQGISDISFSGGFVRVNFSWVWSLATHPAPNLEVQVLLLVCHLHFDLSSIGGPTRSVRFRQHSSPGHWGCANLSAIRRLSSRRVLWKSLVNYCVQKNPPRNPILLDPVESNLHSISWRSTLILTYCLPFHLSKIFWHEWDVDAVTHSVEHRGITPFGFQTRLNTHAELWGEDFTVGKFLKHEALYLSALTRWHLSYLLWIYVMLIIDKIL